VSGWGFTPPLPSKETEAVGITSPKPTRFNFPPEQKGILMPGREKDGLCDPEVYRVQRWQR
jgi:hypothetical protein